MDKILQGTTPSLRYKFDPTDLNVSTVTALELTIRHKDVENVYGLTDVAVDAEANTITYHFTEAQTLALDPGEYVYYQIRCKLTDNNIVGTLKEKAKVVDLISKETL